MRDRGGCSRCRLEAARCSAASLFSPPRRAAPALFPWCTVHVALGATQFRLAGSSRCGVAASDRPAPLLAGPETAARTRVSSVELAVTRGLRMVKGLDEVARPLIPGRAVLAHARQEIGPAGLDPNSAKRVTTSALRKR